MSGLRDALRSAMTSSAETVEEPPAVEVEAAELAGEGEAAAPEARDPGGDAEAPDADAEAQAARQRDDKGRFAPKGKEGKPAGLKDQLREAAKPKEAPGKEPVKPKEPDTAPGRSREEPAAAATPPPPAEKAPQSWTALEREHFAKAPPEVRAAIARREKEIAKALEETAPARKLSEEFQRTVAPFEGLIRAEGRQPLQVVGDLLQTAVALRTAPPAHKAQLIATMVRNFGVPIEELAAAIDGQPTQPGQPARPGAPAPYRDPRVDQLLTQIQQRERAAVEAKRAEQAREIAAFAEKHEFFADVREQMADLDEVLRKRGLSPTLEELYTQAVRMSPDISAVLAQREKAKAAANAQASTQRAQRAASPVRSQPAAPASGAQPKTLRDQLRAAMSERTS